MIMATSSRIGSVGFSSMDPGLVSDSKEFIEASILGDWVRLVSSDAVCFITTSVAGSCDFTVSSTDFLLDGTVGRESLDLREDMSAGDRTLHGAAGIESTSWFLGEAESIIVVVLNQIVAL